MTYSAYITKLKDVKKHPNADRLQIGKCFDSQVIVGMDAKTGDIGIFFPTDGRIVKEFLEANDLIAKIDPITGERSGGFFDEKGKVRAQRFRKEKSEGFFCPLTYLDYLSPDYSKLKEGTAFSEIEGKKICWKYIPQRRASSSGPRQAKAKSKFIYFREHKETGQLQYNLSEFKPGDFLIISEKLHGTSARSSNSLEQHFGKIAQIVNKLTRRQLIDPVQEYKYVYGSRKVVITPGVSRPNGWYGENEGFRQKCHDLFEGKLRRGETVYYEIVGWAAEGVTIMPVVSNSKLADKAFSKRYGPETVFSYGCAPGTNHVYVYRMTTTDPEGNEVEYDWDAMRRRCEEMAVDVVPELARLKYDGDPDKLTELVNSMLSGPSVLCPAHLREGVVVSRYGSRWLALKAKSFEFKVLEGIIKDSGVADIEESQELDTETNISDETG